MKTALVAVPNATDIARYEVMCRAIAECHRIDEVKGLRDKAMALEVYARQAQNLEAERKACEIRLRAERRCGELLREMEKAKGSQGKIQEHLSSGRTMRPRNNKDTDGEYRRSHDETIEPKTLAVLGISKTQSSRWRSCAENNAQCCYGIW